MVRVTIHPHPGRADVALHGSSFDDLVEPHLEALRVVARGIVGSDDLANDAVQDALVCLWRLDVPPADLRGWLVRTVVHKSLHVDRARRRRSLHEDRAASWRPESCPMCVEAVDEDEEWRRALDAALDSLSDELRTVFLLRQHHGLEYEAIANRLAVPIGTVRSRLKRARDKLAERLGVCGPRATTPRAPRPTKLTSCTELDCAERE